MKGLKTDWDEFIESLRTPTNEMNHDSYNRERELGDKLYYVDYESFRKVTTEMSDYRISRNKQSHV